MPRSRGTHRRLAVVERIAPRVLIVAVTLAPLPYGSRDPDTVAWWCLILGIGVVVAPVRHLCAGHLRVLFVISVIVAGYAFVLHEQLAHAPLFASFHPAWRDAAELLNAPHRASVSVVRDEPFFALGAPIANLLVLVLGILVGADRDDARRIVRAAGFAGVAYAVFGVGALVLDPGTLLWREKTAYVGSLTGTFVNRNTAATYFGAIAVVWLSVVLHEFHRRLPEGDCRWRDVLHRTAADRRLYVDLVVPSALFVVCLVAVFLTLSRAGVLSSLLVLAIVFAVVFHDRLQGRRALLSAAAGMAMVITIVVQVMGGGVGFRFDMQGFVDAGRIAAWRWTLAIIADHPVFGTGLGTFAAVSPAYRSDEVSMSGVWDAAHSTPLELAAELGLPLASAVALAWLGALVLLLRGALTGRRREVAPLAGFGVALLALLHSCVDFSMQVTGFAIVAFGLVGVGIGAAVTRMDERDRSDRAGARSGIS